ncbi:methyltransferase-like protein 27 [Xenia sp. Carnegie-2017]|uniref:methyltransferase-like protein 27 n=1 Tax=Xenia sp. Carnegie-2017 TaxID=2897299 RepID=UPI001F03A594|nr:methyltransferase-like protein 27 [Xenia sp. Carnegie-2017]
MEETKNLIYKKVSNLKATTTQKELAEVYAEWGPTYDKLIDDLSYTGPAIGAAKLNEKLKELGHDNNVSIVDLGCGTGLVGEQLYNLGYKNIDGMDLSEHMLKVAEEKGVYRSLHKGIMGSDGSVDLGVEPKQYDAVICVGVFASGHVKGEGMNDFLFVVKAGGLIVFNINESVIEDSDYKYHEKMEELSNQGKWKLLLKTYERKYNAHRGAYFYVYQKIRD